MSELPSQDTIRAIESLNDGAVFAADGDRNIIAFGPDMEALTGFLAKEVLGRHCLTAIRCEHCLRGCGVYDEGEVTDVPMVLYRKDGVAISVLKTARVITHADGTRWALEQVREGSPAESEAAGQPEDDGSGTDGSGTDGSGTDGSATDASARNHGATAGPPGMDPIEALDRAMTALGRWFVTMDKELRILRCSASLPELIGRSEPSLTGAPLADILSPGLFADGAEFRTAVLRGERREGWRGMLKTAQGAPLPVSVSAAPVGETPGSAPGTGCAPSAAVLVMMRPQDEVPTSPEGTTSFEGMVARSPSMLKIFKLIEHLRGTDATVLITGESGTGKELVAHALHNRSHRRAGPFVAINCGALPEALLESELFGYMRGAFTGAVGDKPGRFELANGGTVFLDEIGDLPLPLQVKLLRVVQERSFERLGDTRTRTIDVRIVAATHEDLAVAVAERRFREDLYYRLRVVPIELPPLRARAEDLEPLIAHLLDRIGLRRGRALRLSPAAMRALLTWRWPGNVRELENALEYATAVCEGQTIHVVDLPQALSPAVGAAPSAPRAVQPVGGGAMAGGGALERPAAGAPYWGEVDGHEPARQGPERWADPSRPARPNDAGPRAMNQPDTGRGAPDEGRHVRSNPSQDGDERNMLREALDATGWRRQAAADRLGMSRWTLWRKMKEYGLYPGG